MPSCPLSCCRPWQTNTSVSLLCMGWGGQEVHVRPMQVVPESEVHLECLGGVHFNYYLPQTLVRNVVVEGLQPPKPPKRANYRRLRKIITKYDRSTDSLSDESSYSDVTTNAESQPSAAVISESKSQDRKNYFQTFKISWKKLQSREDTMAVKTGARRQAQQAQQESDPNAGHGSPFSFGSDNARWGQRQCADPVLLKLRYYLNQLSIEGVTKPAEWDKSVVEFVSIAHKLCLIEEVICFKYGAGTRELAVPIVPLADLHLLVKQVHVTLNHTGCNKMLKMARTKMYHPQLANAAIKIVQECKLCQEYKGQTITQFSLERRIEKYPYQVVDLMDLPKTVRLCLCHGGDLSFQQIQPRCGIEK